ncbi:hypothetical protein CBR_g47944 [Chara braunii]|uniref:Uncharacterized protein n=1 Tax=Chara braunii TaxID=69332 RepID=A0A388M1N6_CHABU|nr:hypothetical protein CBR_g47944 [Chara braunii]|eukprot:GBG88474.1 hypothetical protein CBR_g47944 [Chara braunii]
MKMKLRLLKLRIDELQKTRDVASTSTEVSNSDEIIRLRRKQEAVKITMEKRLATLEEVILALQKQCEVAEANAEVWRNEALRPGNKRGSVAVGQTPSTEARVRPRTTPMVSPHATGRVDQRLKELVNHNKQEVELLKEMRFREVNGRKESEKGVERLKEEMARLQTCLIQGTNLRKKIDAAAHASTAKKKPAEASPVILVSHREATLRATRRELRNLKKDVVRHLCEEEGVTYTTLDAAKEAVAQARAEKAMIDDELSKDLGKSDDVVKVTDADEALSKDGGSNSAES